MELLIPFTQTLTLHLRIFQVVLTTIALLTEGSTGTPRPQVGLPLVEEGPPTWRLVSAGTHVTVDPPWATCGSQVGSSLNLSHTDPVQAGLRSVLMEASSSGVTPTPGVNVDDGVLMCINTPCPGKGTWVTPTPERMMHVHNVLSVPCYENWKDPCDVGLEPLSCPPIYTVTMRVRERATKGSSLRVLLETAGMQILFKTNETARLSWRNLKLKVDTIHKHAVLYFDGGLQTASTSRVLEHTGRKQCRFYLGTQGERPSIYADIDSIRVTVPNPRNSSSQQKNGAVSASDIYTQCPCPGSHPVSSVEDPYLCITSETSDHSPTSQGVYGPSVGLDTHQVLVDPSVLTDNTLHPYYWVSAPGIDRFSLILDLGSSIKVGRVRLFLLTPSTPINILSRTQIGASWDSWFIFGRDGQAMPDGSHCADLPSSPVRRGSASYWILDTANNNTSTYFYTTMRQLKIEFGIHDDRNYAPLKHHIVAEVQAFTIEIKMNNITLDNLQEYDNAEASALMLPNFLHLSLDGLSPSHQGLDAIPRRTRRQADRQNTSSPIVMSIHPSFAPANGTIIYIKGENFGRPNATVMIGNLTCHCIDFITTILPYSNLPEPGCNTDNEIACVVVLGGEFIGLALDITVLTANGTEAIIDGNITFTFRPNPLVLGVSPRTQYIAGGRRVYVAGENLDSGFKATLFLTTYVDDNTRQYNAKASWLYSEPCILHNRTIMECITQRADVPKKYQIRRKRRDVNQKLYIINDAELTVRINIQIGDTYIIDLYEEIDEKGIMYISKDATWRTFPDGVYNLRLYEQDNPALIIEGDMLSVAAEMQDYNVTVGGVTCVVTRLFLNTIHCMPPKEEDIPTDGYRDNNGDPRVVVVVGGIVPFTPGVVKYLRTKPVDPIPILAGMLGTVGFLLVVIVVFVIWWQRDIIQQQMKREKWLSNKYSSLVTGEKSMLDLIDAKLRTKVDACTLDPNSVRRFREIGQGNFGKVYIGTRSIKSADDTHMEEHDVAIKTIKESHNRTVRQLEDFIEEAIIMLDFDHDHVLRLIGVVIENDVPFVVLPYMANADLQKYVSNPQKNLNQVELLNLLVQVAKGMAHVSSKGAVHRDLRAVNCMVDANIVVKVGDFGLARWTEGQYYLINTDERPLPAKWLAPEALLNRKFSTFTDVWSYGIVMWEVMTKGNTPYAGVGNHRMIEYLWRGRRMSKPDSCPDSVYNIMTRCWDARARSRPHFTELVHMVGTCISGLETDTNLEEQLPAGDYLRMLGQTLDVSEVAVPPDAAVTSISQYQNATAGDGTTNGGIVNRGSHMCGDYLHSPVLGDDPMATVTSTYLHNNVSPEGGIDNGGMQTVNEGNGNCGDHLHPPVPGEVGDLAANVCTESPLSEGNHVANIAGCPQAGQSYFLSMPSEDNINASGHAKQTTSEYVQSGEEARKTPPQSPKETEEAVEPASDHEESQDRGSNHPDNTNKVIDDSQGNDPGCTNGKYPEVDSDCVNQNGQDDKVDSVNHRDSPQEGRNEGTEEKKTTLRSSTKGPDYTNKKATASSFKGHSTTSNHVVEMGDTESDKPAGGVKSLAAMFGGSKTSDYVNHPSHNARSKSPHRVVRSKDPVVKVVIGSDKGKYRNG